MFATGLINTYYPIGIFLRMLLGIVVFFVYDKSRQTMEEIVVTIF